MIYIKAYLWNQHKRELWQIYHNQLLGFISSKISDKETAKDILHEVFIKIHTNLQNLEDPIDPIRLRSWIYQITRNTIIDYYRSKKSNEEIPEWILNDEKMDVDEEIQEELSLCLGYLYLIAKLPQKYKTAIQISEIEGKTQQELADYEHITLSGAKSRVQRGRNILKDMIFQCVDFELNNSEKIVDLKIKDEKNCKLVQDKDIGFNI